jgi:MFS family permease
MISLCDADLVVSEIVGRKPIYRISLFFYFIFTLPSALAPNIGTMLAGRLVSSVFSSLGRCYEE